MKRRMSGYAGHPYINEKIQDVREKGSHILYLYDLESF